MFCCLFKGKNSVCLNFSKGGGKDPSPGFVESCNGIAAGNKHLGRGDWEQAVF